MKNNPHENHRARMRKRYLTQGLEGFADHEVLELLLYYAYPRCDTNPIAHNMLNEFGSLHNLCESDVKTIMTRLKCTEKVATLVSLVPQLAKRYFVNKWGDNVVFDDAKTAGSFCISLFVGDTVEKFYVICADKNNKLINTQLISEGTLDESAVYPREIVRAALDNNAASIILTHNHPSGSFRPSRNDLETTRHITETAERVGFDVLDHIIVAGDAYYSFAARQQHVKGY